MTIEFQYTFEDYREAAMAYRGAVAWQRVEKARKQKKPSVVIGILIFSIATAGVMVARSGWLKNNLQKFNPFDLIIPFGAILFVLLIGRLASPQTKTDGRNTRLIVGIVSWIFFFAVIGVLFLMQKVGQTTPIGMQGNDLGPPSPTMLQQLFDTVTSHFVWLALIVLIGWLAARGNKVTMQRNWETSPNLHREFKVEITGERIIFATAVSKQEFGWSAFTRMDESEHLFLLGISSSIFHIIPKRAFASDMERDAFRNITRGQIRNQDDPEQEVAFSVIQNSPTSSVVIPANSAQNP